MTDHTTSAQDICNFRGYANHKTEDALLDNIRSRYPGIQVFGSQFCLGMVMFAHHAARFFDGAGIRPASGSD